MSSRLDRKRALDLSLRQHSDRLKILRTTCARVHLCVSRVVLPAFWGLRQRSLMDNDAQKRMF